MQKYTRVLRKKSAVKPIYFTILNSFLNFFFFSEEADDLFNESHISPIRNCSFASLSQKIDDQRYAL